MYLLKTKSLLLKFNESLCDRQVALVVMPNILSGSMKLIYMSFRNTISFSFTHIMIYEFRHFYPMTLSLLSSLFPALMKGEYSEQRSI